MQNHGAIVVSDSVENVVVETIASEKAARYHLECVAVGGAEIADAEVRGGKAMYRTHFLPQMWRANFERLRRSDPDLFTEDGGEARASHGQVIGQLPPSAISVFPVT